MTEQKAVPVAWWHRKGYQFANAKPGGDKPFADVWEPLFDKAALDAAVAAERAWRDAVEEMLTVAHMVASDDPRESINRLINWHVAVALDPAVSSDAAALVAAERELCAKLADEYATWGGSNWAAWFTKLAAAIRLGPAE